LDINGSINGEIISSNRFSKVDIVSGTIIESSFLHFKTVGISVENSLVVDERSEEINSDFFSFAIRNINWKSKSIDLNNLIVIR